MNPDYLFRGLLAALRLEDIEFIDTRDDVHHDSFRRVVHELEALHDQFPNIPATFVPSPFTGRYRELDDALLRLQRGLVGAQNPFYPGVNLSVSQDRAQKILDSYSMDERDLFFRLAQIYLGRAAASESPT